jgi:hypothetical protein
MTFKIGEKVKWMKTTRKGSSISFDTKVGTVMTIAGKSAVVKDSRGRSQAVKLLDIRHANQPSPVNDVFEGMANRSPKC